MSEGAVAKWALEIARQRRDVEFELLDIKDFNLLLLDKPLLLVAWGGALKTLREKGF